MLRCASARSRRGARSSAPGPAEPVESTPVGAVFSVTTLLRLLSGKSFRIVPEERSASVQGTASKMRSPHLDHNLRRNRMQYRTLGRTGIKVSPYALGAMMFGAERVRTDLDEIGRAHV